MTLLERAAAIPHMGARTIGPQLTAFAAACKTNIVECGSWLGAGTAYLAIGAARSGAKVHVYDNWRVRPTEIAKAAAFGLKITASQNTLPIVREILAPFGADIAFHQGQILDAQWTGEPIGLFVLDAAKRNPFFAAAVRTFFPFFEDGATAVMMDFHFYQSGGDKYRDQIRFMDKHPEFELVEDRLGGDTSVAVFRYHRPVTNGRTPEVESALSGRCI